MDDPGQLKLAELARFFTVLGDETRLFIFERLIQGVQCNCEIGNDLDLPMNLISHHLKVLREAGLVRGERDIVDKRWVYYSVDPVAMARFRDLVWVFLDPERIRDRLPSCGPRARQEQILAT